MVKKKSVVILSSIIVFALMAGCGKDDIEVNDSSTNEVETMVSDENAEEDVVSGKEIEVEESSVVDVITPDTFLDEQGITEPVVVIWNDRLKLGTVVKNVESEDEFSGYYSVGEEDKILLCNPEGVTSTLCSGIEMGDPNIELNAYEYKIQKSQSGELMKESQVSIAPEVNGQRYYYRFILFREERQIEKSSDGEELTGEEWIKYVFSMTEDEHKFIVLNDEIGKRDILGKGEEYQLESGDKIVIYAPDTSCYLVYAEGGTIDMESNELTANAYCIPLELDMEQMGESETIKVELMNNSGYHSDRGLDNLGLEDLVVKMSATFLKPIE